MKHYFTISVPNACPEKLGNHPATINGVFCNSCNKEVIDFSTKSEKEILQYFLNTKEKSCGIFHATQLKKYPIRSIPVQHKIKRWAKTALATLVILSVAQLGQAQDPQHEMPKTELVAMEKSKITQSTKQELAAKSITITGVVVDQEGNGIPGVTIMFKGTTVGCISDINGEYSITSEFQKGAILTFSFVGLKTQEIAMSEVVSKNNSSPLNITMESVTMHPDLYILAGTVAVEKHKNEPKTRVGKFLHQIKSIF